MIERNHPSYCEWLLRLADAVSAEGEHARLVHRTPIKTGQLAWSLMTPAMQDRVMGTELDPYRFDSFEDFPPALLDLIHEEFAS